jgi:hypothetical protein
VVERGLAGWIREGVGERWGWGAELVRWGWDAEGRGWAPGQRRGWLTPR